MLVAVYFVVIGTSSIHTDGPPEARSFGGQKRRDTLNLLGEGIDAVVATNYMVKTAHALTDTRIASMQHDSKEMLTHSTEVLRVVPIIAYLEKNRLPVFQPGHRDRSTLKSHFVSAMFENKIADDDRNVEIHNGHAFVNPKPDAMLPSGGIDQLQRRAAWEKTCVPMNEWQKSFHPTCNLMHEAFALDQEDNEQDIDLLSAGGSWRMAWRVHPRSSFLEDEAFGNTKRDELLEKYNSIPEIFPAPKIGNCTALIGNLTAQEECINANKKAAKLVENFRRIDEDYGHSYVLKMLRVDRDFNEETFHNNQVDAIAMDRLTASPFVIDSFGFCGQSVLTELASGGSGRELVKRVDLEPRKRLRIARNLAMGLAHMHSVDDKGKNGQNVSLVHNDLNLENLLLVKSSTIKFGDFNIAMLARKNRRTGAPCGHPVLFESPLWRSPEEIRNDGSYVNEKVDIYSFGAVLFNILTKHQPWTWLELEKPSIEIVAEKKLRGDLPKVPEKYSESENMATQALYIATMMCFAPNPEDRPTAMELATGLANSYHQYFLFKRKKRKKLSFDELNKIFGLG